MCGRRIVTPTWSSRPTVFGLGPNPSSTSSARKDNRSARRDPRCPPASETPLDRCRSSGARRLAGARLLSSLASARPVVLLSRAAARPRRLSRRCSTSSSLAPLLDLVVSRAAARLRVPCSNHQRTDAWTLVVISGRARSGTASSPTACAARTLAPCTPRVGRRLREVDGDFPPAPGGFTSASSGGLTAPYEHSHRSSRPSSLSFRGSGSEATVGGSVPSGGLPFCPFGQTRSSSGSSCGPRSR
jgi:hypothetical protein